LPGFRQVLPDFEFLIRKWRIIYDFKGLAPIRRHRKPGHFAEQKALLFAGLQKQGKEEKSNLMPFRARTV